MSAPEPVITTVASEEELRRNGLGRRLRQFNFGFVGDYPVEPLWLVAKDSAGTLVGGLSADVVMGWLRVNVLWVEEGARCAGLGTRLLGEAERRARAMGARNVWLETFEWQAPGFYLKQGYQEFSRIEDYTEGFYLAFMKKVLWEG